jgi:hypothetical protein
MLLAGILHHVVDDHLLKDEGLFYRFRHDDGTLKGGALLLVCFLLPQPLWPCLHVQNVATPTLMYPPSLGSNCTGLACFTASHVYASQLTPEPTAS